MDEASQDDADEQAEALLAGVTPPTRKRDAATMLELMTRVTGEAPRLWGSVVGFGHYHYRYASGREGDGPAAAFAPRKAATVVYLPDGVGAHAGLLGHLGPHRTGVGCLYLKDLEDVDVEVLGDIVRNSFETVTSGTYGLRAREGGG